MRTIIGLSLVMLAMVTPPAWPQVAQNPEARMGAALHEERVTGNLQRAIDGYRNVLATKGVSRSLAAQALYHIGICYEKLGDLEARKAFESVVRNYGDQVQLASQARARLVAMGLGNGGDTRLVIRQVWSGEEAGAMSAPSPDGRYLVYTEWTTKGNLAIRDLRAGESRNLTKEDGYVESAVFLADGKRIIFAWFTYSTQQFEVRMINIDGSNPEKVVDASFVPMSASPDGKLIAGFRYGDSTRQVAILDLSTRKLAPLKTVAWTTPAVGSFSPDSRYLAYALTKANAVEGSTIYLIAVDGSADSAVVTPPGVHERPFFTPDGSRVVFVSSRSGRSDLWAVPVAGGKATAEPSVLKTDIGDEACLGFSLDGSLFFSARTEFTEADAMDLDTSSWRAKGEPRRVSTRFTNINEAPVWSPDGKRVAYVSHRRTRPGEVTYVIRDVASSEEKEFGVSINPAPIARGFRWFPDGQALLLGEYAQADGKFRRLDLTDGSVKTLFQPPTRSQGYWGAVSADGRAVYYGARDQTPDPSPQPGQEPFTLLVKRDLATGGETSVGRARGLGLASIITSPDGRYVAFFAACATQQGWRCLWAVPLAGGEPRELAAPKGRFIQNDGIAWTPHSEGVFTTVTEELGQARSSEIWFLPLDGASPHNVGIPVRRAAMPAVHPQGYLLGFTERTENGHVSVMQNLFPRIPVER